MPLTANNMRVTFQFALDGGIDNGGDIAEPSLWMYAGPTAPPDWQDALDGYAEDCYAAWSSNWSDGLFPNAVVLTGVRVTRFNAALEAQEIGQYAAGSPWAGSDTSSVPWQLSCCVGLYGFPPGSYTPKNRQKRGRIYLPPMSKAAIENSKRGNLTSGNITLIGDAMLAMMDDMDSATRFGASGTDQPYGPLVVSRAAQQVTQVTHLRLDQVFDTQRRRINSETRTVTVRTR